jgi:Leucine-rich repeat (LRR) protein
VNGNKLKKINLSAQTELAGIDLDENPIKTIDLQKMAKLNWLSVSGTKIKKLNIGNNAVLQTLYLARTPVSALKIPVTTELRTLDIRKTKITKLDLRQSELASFDARVTKVTVRVIDPAAFASMFQTTIDEGVTVKK